ncbi:MAG TPA: response regulator [Planctomycetota bacterium]|nr:response regulator [Planctomycetota bacterium]
MSDEPIRVLLIEDNPGDARFVRVCLDGAGGAQFVLEHATRLASGLDRLAMGDVDVVLLDLGLPDSHGLGTLEVLRTRAPDTPTVVLTGFDDDELGREAVQAGAQDYLLKGQVDGRLLVRAIRYAIARSRRPHQTEATRQRGERATQPEGSDPTAVSAPFEAYDGDKPFLFASYAHADTPAVYPELLYLHQQACRIWYDEGIAPTSKWPDEIARAILKSSSFLVFLSPNAVQSQNVLNEINFAIRRRKPFLAVYLTETELPDGLDLMTGIVQAVHKHRMSKKRYRRLLLSGLPRDVVGTAGSDPGSTS